MRLVVIGVEGIEPRLLLDDRRHIHVQALRDEGIVGSLTVDADDGVETLWSAIAGTATATEAELGEETEPRSDLRTELEEFRHCLGDQAQGDAAIVVRWPDEAGNVNEDGAIDPWLERVDGLLRQTIEQLLERAEEATILLVVLDRPRGAEASERKGTERVGGFVLSSSRGLPAGEIPGDVRLIDLASTVLKLAGRPLPEHLGGSPIALEKLVSRVEDDELAVLERLRGLGYLS